MTEHHWSEPMPWQQEQQDRAVLKMRREAEIPVPADDDTDPTGAVVAWAIVAFAVFVAFALGCVTGATFFRSAS